ncbi:MAG TPA: DUF4342 domain-containing protein [Clostridiaceae bacterium]|nr:DUF4342 domain-containing protein [Clostridiaceae bacterium]
MITIEQIDEFRKRTHSSYEDAKFFLEKNNGDILDAIIDFERTKTGKGTSRQSQKQKNDLGDKFADILQKGIDTKIIVEDKESVLLRIPIIILLLLIPLWVFVLLFAILLSTLGYKFNIREEKSQNVNVNSIFQNINSKLKDNETDKNNTRKRYSKSDDNSRTQTTQNNSSNVPIEIATDISNESETHEPVNDFDNEEGYNEYTVE